MSKEKKSSWIGSLIGLGMVGLALSALWKNETRFDYHREASRTVEVQDFGPDTKDRLISYTDVMDTQQTLAGLYLKKFQGFLYVDCTAQVYCWCSQRNDKQTTWSRRWSTHISSNYRNDGIRKTLQSKTYDLQEYRIGDLLVEKRHLEFADPEENISPSTLELTEESEKLKLQKRSDCLYLKTYGSSSTNPQLGDQRLIFRGRPIPEKATYFGKYDGHRGVADTSQVRDGFVSNIIQDTGILHHLVVGDRQEALTKLAKKIRSTKWIVRLAGTFAVCFGLVFTFSTIFGFLVHIPIMGRVIQYGLFAASVIVGLTLSIGTIVTSYLISHPSLLVTIIALVIAAIWWIYFSGNRSQTNFLAAVKNRFTSRTKTHSLKELEFLELAAIAKSDHNISEKEVDFLYQWGKKQGWPKEKCDELISEISTTAEGNDPTNTSEVHLKNIILLSFADGHLSSFEHKTIWQLAKKIGYQNYQIRELIDSVKSEVAANPS